MLGKVILNMEYKQQAAKVALVAVKSGQPSLLGRKWLNKFRLNCEEILQTRGVGDVTDLDVAVILQSHEQVFE